MRKCKACQNQLVRKPGERTGNWNRRTVCDERCRLAVLNSRLRELDSQRIEVACECGVKVLRSARFKHSKAVRCYSCTDAFRQANAATKRATLLVQARRYRILLAVSPYGTYEALLDALRVRNPHTREYHHDLSMERRAAEPVGNPDRKRIGSSASRASVGRQ